MVSSPGQAQIAGGRRRRDLQALFRGAEPEGPLTMSAAGRSCTMPSAVLIDAVRFSEPGGIGPAAERLRDAVMDLCGLRTAVTHNVASREPMRDGNGAELASGLFGFRGEEPRWWEGPQLDRKRG